MPLSRSGPPASTALPPRPDGRVSPKANRAGGSPKGFRAAGSPKGSPRAGRGAAAARRANAPASAPIETHDEEENKSWMDTCVEFGCDALDELLLLMLALGGTAYLVHILASRAGDAIFEFAEASPVVYLSLNFGAAAAVGLGFLLLKDVQDLLERISDERLSLQRRGEPGTFSQASLALWERWRSSPAEAGYEAIEEHDVEKGGAVQRGSSKGEGGSPKGTRSGAAAGAAAGGGAACDENSVSAASAALVAHTAAHGAASTAQGKGKAGGEGSFKDKGDKEMGAGEMRKELRKVTDQVEELQIKCKVHKGSSSEQASEMRAQLRTFEARLEELTGLLRTIDSSQHDGKAAVSTQGLKS